MSRPLRVTDSLLLSVETLRPAKLKGYTGGKTALYALIRDLRPTTIRPLVRFEGLAGELPQHDFGHVDVRFLDSATKRVHIFAGRLKYSRWVKVTLVPDERTETLVRAWVDHFAAIGGLPLLRMASAAAFCSSRSAPMLVANPRRSEPLFDVTEVRSRALFLHRPVVAAVRRGCGLVLRRPR